MRISRKLCITPLVLLFGLQTPAQSTTSPLEKAQVTFYSGGNTIFGKPRSEGAFFGKIFDGEHELALLERHRFVTFAFDPGFHTLSSNVWMSSHPGGDSRVIISLVAGKHYFINTAFEATNWLGGMRLVFQEITCGDALALGVDTKPLEHKHLRRDGIPLVVKEAKFPSCP